MRELLLSTSITPPRLERPVVMTSAGSRERWSSEEHAARDLELLRATLERATRWPPQRDIETRQWRERAVGSSSGTLSGDLVDWAWYYSDLLEAMQ